MSYTKNMLEEVSMSMGLGGEINDNVVDEAQQRWWEGHLTAVGPVSSKHFHWDARKRTFVAELSQLTEGGRRGVFCRAYSDACDQGIQLLSERTGRVAMFVVEDETENGDETQAWTLVPTRQALAACPGLAGVVMTIFND